MIKDSGERRTFQTGAVRDIQENKGRCDLLPLDVVGKLMADEVIAHVGAFVSHGDESYLYLALETFIEKRGDYPTAILEVAKHFEEGAKKYAENNWKLGINTKHYVDSGVRHYLKHLRGDNDEPHDRAFIWNMLCCIWTCKNKPELNDYKKDCVEE